MKKLLILAICLIIPIKAQAAEVAVTYLSGTTLVFGDWKWDNMTSTTDSAEAAEWAGGCFRGR